MKVVKKLEIKNRLGMHARAAMLIVQTVKRYSSEVKVSKDGSVADARSILGLLTLGAARGTMIQIEATGKDAGAVVKALERLVERKFHETE